MHHAVEIPFHEIGPQIFNFLVFASILFYLLRKPTIQMFANRASNYHAAVNKASQALEEAKARKTEIESKLTEMKRGHKESIAQAKKEAEQLKVNAVEEARAEAKRMAEEAERTIRVELDKAKAELRTFMLQQAISMADKDLGGQLDANEQKRLQKEFVEKIQV
jgi:F-type H+-transporting ATPase subunit b